MIDLIFPEIKKCLFCKRPDNYYEIIPFCPSCLEGFSFSGEGPGILYYEGIVPQIIKEAEKGREELINPLAKLLFLDCKLRGLRGKGVACGENNYLDKKLARETSFFLNLPLISSHPNALVVGVYWTGKLKDEYPPERVLALIK